jgi:mlo protein
MTQMGWDIKLHGFGSSVHESVKSWFDEATRKTTMKNTGGDDADPDSGAEVDVTHAPNERFGSSRSMLTATPSSPG